MGFIARDFITSLYISHALFAYIVFLVCGEAENVQNRCAEFHSNTTVINNLMFLGVLYCVHTHVIILAMH